MLNDIGALFWCIRISADLDSPQWSQDVKSNNLVTGVELKLVAAVDTAQLSFTQVTG
jgi:hypothetical protein